MKDQITDIDIARLREAAEFFYDDGHELNEGCLYAHGWCFVRALLDRLERAEAQRDRLANEDEARERARDKEVGE